MKLLMATILLMGAMNSFAACIADGACDSQTECNSLTKDGKKFDFDSSAKKCVVSKQQDQLPDCKFVYDGKGGEQPAGSGTKTEAGASAVGK